MHRIIVSGIAALAFVLHAAAALKTVDGDLQVVDHRSVAVYKTTPQGELKINLYFPEGWKPSDHRPGIVLFFGGGFVAGTPAQFTTKAEYLASRGMVAASAEYRIKNKHQTPPEKCAEDAKSAVRWVRINARRLGIDPGRVIAGGGSAGGTIAVFTAFNTAFEPEGEDMSVSSRPDALVLYNPALGFPDNQPPNELSGFITQWKVTAGGPPAILFFGTEDALAEKAKVFAKQMAEAGNRVEFYSAAGEKHGFFNDTPGRPWHALTLRQTDVFLTSLGYLKGEPTLVIPAGTTASLKKLTGY